MSQSIFYSWQSDSSAKTNRYFIRDCVADAIKKLNKDQSLTEAVRIDHDTANVPGSPDIANTIFAKISGATVFVADLTLCSASSTGKRSPNPNVLIELGFALSEIGDAHVIGVMNTESGEPASLPFDLSHKRWPIQYKLDEATATSKTGHFARTKDKLTNDVYNAIRLIVSTTASATPDPAVTNSPPSLAYIESRILSSDPRADWEIIATNWVTTAVSRQDVNLRLVISTEEGGVQNDDFKEEWANRHPDPRACGYWCDIFYSSTHVKRSILVAVDGARAMLPVPRQAGNDGKISEVLPFDYRLAQIFDTLATLDDYLMRSRLTIAFSD